MIIVTGGAGFIGSNIVAGLEREGFKDIAIADWLGTGEKWRNLAKRELAAVVDPDCLPAFLTTREKEIDTIVHMGAVSTTTETDADLIVRSNFTLTMDLWTFCRDKGKRLIYASSAATYGGGENGFYDRADQEYLNALRPLNAYGWSKALTDRRVAREIAEGRGTPPQWAGLKFFNVYGPNEYHKGGQKSVVAHIFPDAKAGRAVKLFKSYNLKYADGGQLRDFVWVGDCVNVVMWLLRNPKVSGIFNVGSGKARSFEDLARATFAALGVPAKIEYVDMPEELRGKYQYFTQSAQDKLIAAGYDGLMSSLEDGVRSYVEEYLDRHDRYS